MTSESASQSIAPGRADDVPDRWDERTILTTFLDYARDTVQAKCADLAEPDARLAPLPGSPLLTVSSVSRSRCRSRSCWRSTVPCAPGTATWWLRWTWIPRPGASWPGGPS